MMKAFPHHTPFTPLKPDSPTAYNKKTTPRASCIVMIALASPNVAQKHSVRLSEVNS